MTTFKDLFEADLTLAGKPRTKDYRFTMTRDNPTDALKYRQLKKEVSDHNKSLVKGETNKYGQSRYYDQDGNPAWKKYIQRFGRLGRDNPASSKYDLYSPDRDPTRPYRRSYAGPQRVHPDDAQRFDVYVRTRDPSIHGYDSASGLFIRPPKDY